MSIFASMDFTKRTKVAGIVRELFRGCSLVPNLSVTNASHWLADSPQPRMYPDYAKTQDQPDDERSAPSLAIANRLAHISEKEERFAKKEAIRLARASQAADKERTMVARRIAKQKDSNDGETLRDPDAEAVRRLQEEEKRGRRRSDQLAGHGFIEGKDQDDEYKIGGGGYHCGEYETSSYETSEYKSVYE